MVVHCSSITVLSERAVYLLSYKTHVYQEAFLSKNVPVEDVQVRLLVMLQKQLL